MIDWRSQLDVVYVCRVRICKHFEAQFRTEEDLRQHVEAKTTGQVWTPFPLSCLYPQSFSRRLVIC
jgi:hypothetical protein